MINRSKNGIRTAGRNFGPQGTSLDPEVFNLYFCLALKIITRNRETFGPLKISSSGES